MARGVLYLLAPLLYYAQEHSNTTFHNVMSPKARTNTDNVHRYDAEHHDALAAHLSTASAPFTSPSAGVAPSCRTTSAAVSSTTSVRVTFAYRPATRQAFFTAAEDPADARSSMMTLRDECASQRGEKHARDCTGRSANARALLRFSANTTPPSKDRSGWRRRSRGLRRDISTLAPVPPLALALDQTCKRVVYTLFW